MSDRPMADWEVTVAMWEDLINLAAFQIVHGPLHGYLRYRYLRFGIPETEPVPAGVDLSRISLPMWRRPTESEADRG